MVRRVSSSSWVAGIVVAAVGFGPQVPPVGHASLGRETTAVVRSDLDSFSDQQLDRDLQDELDDVFEQHASDDVADVATIQAELMSALSDKGDEGAEAEISFADLEAEMQEAGTDVEDVVHDAIERLDQAAAERPQVHLAAWNGPRDVEDKPSYGLAVRDAKRSLVREIRKAR